MKQSGLKFSNKLKTAKWLFAIAVLLFVAKPFIGFSINPLNAVAQESILVKSFTKRKHEYIENSSLDAASIQKKIADPLSSSFLLFSCFLSILFPLIFAAGFNITNRFIQNIKHSLNPSSNTWLLHSQLII